MDLSDIERDPDAAIVAVEQELGRRSLAAFMRMAWDKVEPDALSWNWHHDAICDHLEAVTRGDIQKLLICVPPGCTKSLSVATFWPAWEWILDPTIRSIFASYASELSEKNAKLHRDLVLSDWFQTRWPHVSISRGDAKKVKHFSNSAKGFRHSTSVGSGVTGRHADRLVFDDLCKAQDAQGRAAVRADAIEKANDFWFKTMTTRRASPRHTRRVGIMQRLHFEDTAGKCRDSGEYAVLSLPMEYDPRSPCMVEVTGWRDPRTEQGELLWPDRFPEHVVEELKEDLGPVAAAAQLQQNPAPRKGAIFDADHLKNHWQPRRLPRNLRKIITADCTFKDTLSSDYVVVQCWGVAQNRFYLLDQIRGRMKVKRTARAVLTMHERHPTAVGTFVEDKANGPSVIDILDDLIPALKEWSPGRSSKEERAEAVCHLFEKNVFLPPPETPWLGDYIAELTKFPLGKNDDQVDATTMALLILHKTRHRKYKKAAKNWGKFPML